MAKVTIWENIPHVLAHCPGQLNSLAHVLSHVAEELQQMKDERNENKRPQNAYPVTMHSYYGPTRTGRADAPPEGYVVNSLPLQSSDITELSRALHYKKISGSNLGLSLT